MKNAYAMTLVPESPWSRLSPSTKKRLIYSLWVVTDIGLIAGLFDPAYWTWVLLFTIPHALLFLGLVGFRPLVFPAQLRIAYVLWLAIGIYVPHMSWMMYVTTVGLSANLLYGYCPLSRLLYLLPWNREVPLDATRFVESFLTPPMPGRFRLPAE